MNFFALLSNMFGGDGIIIFLVLLLLFGAKRLPELAKGLGSAVREFAKAKDEIEHEFTRPAVQPPRIETPANTQPLGGIAAVDARVEPQHTTVTAPQTTAPMEPQHTPVATPGDHVTRI